MDDRAASGYTLVELVVTLAVLAMLIGWALPAFSDLIDSQRLRAAALHIAADLRHARNEALTRRSTQPVGVSFSPGSDWCYGISQQLPCACTQADWRAPDACLLDVARERRLQRASADLHPSVEILDARFSGGSVTRFDPIRGLAQAGTVRLRSTRGKQVEIRVSLLGRVRICTPDDAPRLAGFASC